MTRILVAGAGGMLGHDLMTVLEGRDAVGLGRAELDVTDLASVRAAVRETGIGSGDAIINAAAYTRVDDAEADEDRAYAVNATGARHLAIVAAEAGARLLQVSTDYVFDGTASTPYAEDTPRNPVSAYGRTKAEGERLALEAHPAGAFIVRTAWLYGEHGGNFPATMLKLAASRPTVSVVTDQVGQPTWTMDLAKQLVALIDADAPAAVYHGTNSGQASWYEFARAVFGEAGLDPARVEPTDSASFVRPAPRPAYSVLGHDGWARAGVPPMRDWREALFEAVSTGAISSGDSTAQ
ncbi:dTDP-4-dehydrorhamnose reductase [Ruicaihuangia caeni]|uniref:dTDP-4-dehydrorhamnose reductase n=1 Tax=Ruicaihuangia caeni TaxID=3042517 RepID=UPI0033905C9D